MLGDIIASYILSVLCAGLIHSLVGSETVPIAIHVNTVLSVCAVVLARDS